MILMWAHLLKNATTIAIDFILSIHSLDAPYTVCVNTAWLKKMFMHHRSMLNLLLTHKVNKASLVAFFNSIYYIPYQVALDVG